MRTFHPFATLLVMGTVLAACSAPPGTTIIVLGDPAGGGNSSGTPPVNVVPDAGASPGSGPAPAQDASRPPPSMVSTSPEGGSSLPAMDGATASLGLPCDVATLMAAQCVGCHSNPPLPGALAALVTYADLMATAKEDPTKNEAQLSLARMKNAAMPMPPGALPSSSDVAILQNWIDAGYPMGSCGGGSTGGGTAGGDSGGVVVVPPPPSVFDGAPAFAGRTGPNAHNAGRECMGCHTNGGGEAPRFALGGTLYDANGRAVAGAEVRLVDANARATSVYTGSNGTFYVNGAGFSAPAHVGVRNGTAARDMFTPLQASNGGACSSCHCTGNGCTVPLVHLP